MSAAGFRRLLPIFGFVLLALAVAWPLPLRWATHLTGAPTGDTGVYVWNLWIFQHELVRQAHWPFATDHIFAGTYSTDLSAHNYTVFADLLALPFLGSLGVVRTFNLIYIFLIASSGYAAFLLVRRLTGRTLEAWIAGAVFAASPFLVARGTAHFSLVAAAPLPIFLLCVLQMLRTARWRYAVLAGLTMGWAGYCDVYYTVYCLLMAGLLFSHHLWIVERRREPHRGGRALLIINVLLAVGVAVIAWRLWQGEYSTVIFGRVLSFRTLYTPVLLLTVLAIVRQQMIWRLRLRRRPGAMAWTRAIGLTGAALASAAVVLGPVIVALAVRMLEGRFPSPSIDWRSSPPGMDVLDLLAPNPNHPWLGGPAMLWLASRGPLAFPEFVGSLPLVALAVVAFVMWRLRAAIPRIWMAFTALFALLALGPFIQIAGVNTYVPGPWLLLRYVPVVGLARSPARFAVLAALGLAVMLGFALAALRQAAPRRWRYLLPVIAALLAFELSPVPRRLYEAKVPSVYSVVRDDADESMRLLELPGGVRDGTSSIGDFNASAQFFQTVHRQPIVGGYQSRVSERRKAVTLSIPVLAALFRLSERQPISDELAARARATREQFLNDVCLGYVVIDRQRASPELRRLAIELFDLTLISEGDDRELYVPARMRGGGACAGLLGHRIIGSSGHRDIGPSMTR